MTSDKFKTFGKQQADEMKIQLKKYNVTEEFSERVYSLFYYKWCHLVDEVYEEFIYEKLSDYISSVAVRFIYKDIKAISPHFNLIRVKVTQINSPNY